MISQTIKNKIKSAYSRAMKLDSNRHFLVFIFSTLVFLVGAVGYVYAATLTTGSVSLSDPRPSQSSRYVMTFSNVSTTQINCIAMVFSTNASGATAAPSGFSATAATLDTSASTNYVPNPSGWSATAPQANVLWLTYSSGTSPASASTRTVAISGITNGSTAETGYFLRFATYQSTNCTSNPIDSQTIMFIYTNGQSVSLTVDPSLSFSVAAVNSGQSVNNAATTVTTTTTSIPFGTVSSAANAVAAQDLTVGTNASGGFTVYTRYTGTLASGAGPTITDHTGTNASPSTFPAAGTEAFGYTTEDSTLGTGTTDRFTSSGGNKYAGFSTSNAEIAYNNAPTSSLVTRVGFKAGVAASTEAGTYTTTVIYTATPTY